VNVQQAVCPLLSAFGTQQDIYLQPSMPWSAGACKETC